MSFWWKFGILIASYLIVGMAGWKAHTWYDGYAQSKVEAKIIEDRVAEEKKSNDEAQKVETKLADDVQKSNASNVAVQEFVAKTPSLGCPIDATGVRLLQQAVTTHTRAR